MPHDLVMALRLLLAAALGGAVGLEREFSGKPAGYRTLMLVSVGACLFTVLSDSFGSSSDPSRIAAGVVVGVGFLGGGTIWRTEGMVSGLTTAAAIWAAAAIGLAVGGGEYVIASVAAGIVLVALRLPAHLGHKGKD
jgi:putative Mg2+ transporter-C (MgtC) family protein